MNAAAVVFDGTTGRRLDPADFRWDGTSGILVASHGDHHDVRARPYDLDGPVAVIPKRAWVWTTSSVYRVGDVVTIQSLSAIPSLVTCMRCGERKEKVAQAFMAGDRANSSSAQGIATNGLSSHSRPTQLATDDWTPGLYVLEVAAGGSVLQCHPFVLEPRLESPSPSPIDITVVANTQTWHCYNYFGGRSRYRNGPLAVDASGDVGAPKPTGSVHDVRRWIAGVTSARRHPWTTGELSVHRPLHAPGLSSKSPDEPYLDHLAGNEWRTLAWLERNDIPYRLIADSSVHAWAEAAHSKIIVLNGHSEYWTRTGLDALAESHLTRGTSLLNLSGNSLHAAVEWSRPTAIRCTALRIRKSTARSNPANLIGTRTNLANINSCAEFQTTDADHDLWPSPPPASFGHGSLMTTTTTSLAAIDGALPGNGLDVLTGSGASGWEVDRRSNRQFDVLASGANDGGGADIVWRSAGRRRGATLGVPSITAPSCLQDPTMSSLIISAVESMLRTSPR